MMCVCAWCLGDSVEVNVILEYCLVSITSGFVAILLYFMTYIVLGTITDRVGRAKLM